MKYELWCIFVLPVVIVTAVQAFGGMKFGVENF